MHKKIGRNENCPCGSGKKYKKCCAIKTDNIVSLPPMSIECELPPWDIQGIKIIPCGRFDEFYSESGMTKDDLNKVCEDVYRVMNDNLLLDENVPNILLFYSDDISSRAVVQTQHGPSTGFQFSINPVKVEDYSMGQVVGLCPKYFRLYVERLDIENKKYAGIELFGHEFAHALGVRPKNSDGARYETIPEYEYVADAVAFLAIYNDEVPSTFCHFFAYLSKKFESEMKGKLTNETALELAKNVLKSVGK